ncbi:MAG: thiamine pyrophosphate-dependent dehydrogenase E1 component subunit alpha [Elusimicrobiota bacterium]|jgi:2-oxoisovalerate dehydrogenase E1 component alpha subunit
MASRKKRGVFTGPGDPILGMDKALLLRMHRLMTRNRVLEERLIKMSKSGEGFFWIGGPGEEGFNIPLGLLVKKGRGLEHDWLHLHYRSGGVVLAMGAEPIDLLRQMRASASDPYSKGRHFINHFAIPEWNVAPVSPTIETQYSQAVGTALAQQRHGGTGITLVTGGDAGTAEGDFHTCLVWAARPVRPLPVLCLVINNEFGISTASHEQHGEERIADFAHPFNMPSRTINGNDPVESWLAIREAMEYCRRERKPYLLEAVTSRLFGHSSASGANLVDEPDPISDFEERLAAAGLAKKDALKKVRDEEAAAVDEAHRKARLEPSPKPESIWEDVFPGGLPDSYPRKGGS